MSQKTEIEGYERPWLTWGVWAAWIIGALLILQNAVASGQELEPRAAAILWVILAVWLLAGLAVWFVRRDR